MFTKFSDQANLNVMQICSNKILFLKLLNKDDKKKIYGGVFRGLEQQKKLQV